MTAAHCVSADAEENRDEEYQLHVGVTNFDGRPSPVVIDVIAVYTAPRQLRRPDLTDGADMALLYLGREIPAGFTFVRVNSNNSVPPVSAFARATGYGQQAFREFFSVGKLLEVDLPIVSQKECNGTFPFDQDLICTGYKTRECGVCFGDSGGALLQYTPDGAPVIIGIPSKSVGCGSLGFYDGHARVSDFVPWMKAVGAVFEEAGDAVQVFGDTEAEEEEPEPSREPNCPAVLDAPPGEQAGEKDGKLVGIELSPDDARFMVALWTFGLRCSGVLISRFWVITTAECRVEWDWRVLIGGRYGFSGYQAEIDTVFNGTDGRISPFDDYTAGNITLIRLRDTTIDTGASVLVNNGPGLPKVGAFGRFFGYSSQVPSLTFNSTTDRARLLAQLEIPVADQGSCLRNKTVRKVTFCAGFGSESCDACGFSDIGGPLLQYDLTGMPILMGILLKRGNCFGRGSNVGVYADVRKFLPFLRAVGAVFETSADAVQVFSKARPEDESEASPEAEFFGRGSSDLKVGW